MGGTKEGSAKAKLTMLAKYGPDHYAKIGAIGGKLGRTGGFANGEKGRELARRAGQIGGRNSRRGPASDYASKEEKA